MTQLGEELRFAIDLALDCARTARELQAGGRKALGVEQKPDGQGPVTHADRVLNERIVSLIRKRFPGDAVLAEEGAEEAARSGSWRTAERAWHVDPIDGTREFIRGRPGFAVLIGLCIRGEPALGVAAEPAARRLTYGVTESFGRALGQHIDDDEAEPPQLSERSFEELVLMGRKSLPFSRQRAIQRALAVGRDRTLSVGSVGIRMLSVARGDADVYVQPPGRTKTWDTCAPGAIVLASGGVVTDLHGKPLHYRGPPMGHRQGLVCSSDAHYETVLERITALRRSWLGS